MKSIARVGLFPVYRDNPYLNMLYLAARARGYDPRETSTLEGAESILRNLHAGDIFHMQWTAPVVQRAESEEEAALRRRRFESALDAAHERDVTIVWTIHNVLPHDARWHEQELLLCKFLAETAHWVHVMSPATARLTDSLYRLPTEKLVPVPHPSYRGMYTAPPSQQTARSALGVPRTGRAVLFFGQMRPYKGLGTLLRAVAEVNQTAAEPVHLLLAGRTSDDDRAQLESLMPSNTAIIRQHDYISDEDVPSWFAAADLAVFPYEQILNSGSINLAATFGVPVIVPGEPHLREEFTSEAWVNFYEPGDSRSLAATISTQDGSVSLRDAALDYARRRDPFTVSNRWADDLDAMRVGGRPVGGT